MMESKRSISVRLDAEVVNQLEHHRNEDSCDLDLIVGEILFDFFNRPNSIINQLIHGYSDMADINEEIAQAFLGCEQEADRQTGGFYN
ncbi:hypothetical protein HU830_03950 [Lactobacillus sp. DCY120]|uniref:Uncharacterized protein n=1 Tax=Bombilactobacillus apium TaxID=2675299 RepID=A0A850R713_9LACO|nr:hypothetical protein [Bombilactobacillus apium]NVY96325.1 hypothetical protein [Bombilactobacillus apium]